MSGRVRFFALAAALAALVLAARPAMAARVRYHYTVETPGSPTLRPPGAGERLTLRGWQPHECPPPRATCIVNFCHPCSRQTVSVPLALPDSTPTMEYTTSRVIYNYGSDTVEVLFLADGSLYVVYNSGLFRAP
jgi:hypothetical protein